MMILFFLVKELKIDVIFDFSVSFISISLIEDNKLIREGSNEKVTNNETINPKVIIQPKSIIGFIPLKLRIKKHRSLLKLYKELVTSFFCCF